MIVTELYNGQGLGNQLWCYVVTRVISEKKGYDFGIMSKEKFKGKNFLDIDFGKEVIGGVGPEGGPPSKLPDGILNYYKEKYTSHPLNGADISDLDEDLLNISNNTKIDGVMQCENYILDYKEKIKEWIKIKKEIKYENLNLKNTCVIHVRGGDFKGSPAILNSNYYSKAIEKIKLINSEIKFYIVTDDINYCKAILPNIEIIGSSITGVSDNLKASHHIGGDISLDFYILNQSEYVITSNSSFAWWAIWLNPNLKTVIAPKYWARHNQSDGYWSTSGSITKGWIYMDRNGNLFNYNECINEKNNYKIK